MTITTVAGAAAGVGLNGGGGGRGRGGGGACGGSGGFGGALGGDGGSSGDSCTNAMLAPAAVAAAWSQSGSIRQLGHPVFCSPLVSWLECVQYGSVV